MGPHSIVHVVSRIKTHTLPATKPHPLSINYRIKRTRGPVGDYGMGSFLCVLEAPFTEPNGQKDPITFVVPLVLN